VAAAPGVSFGSERQSDGDYQKHHRRYQKLFHDQITFLS
jgi:hypothetical protein